MSHTVHGAKYSNVAIIKWEERLRNGKCQWDYHNLQEKHSNIHLVKWYKLLTEKKKDILESKSKVNDCIDLHQSDLNIIKSKASTYSLPFVRN